MAISTYAELQAAAANWLVRSDLTSRIPEFITLAEARLNRILRARRAESDAALTAVVGARTIALPAAYTEALNCWLLATGETDRTELRFCDPAQMPVSTTNGRPYAWTIDGTNLAFECPAEAAYAITLRILSKYALSDAYPTNALLTDAPDVYLFGTLCEAAPFLRDADLATAYETKFGRAVKELNTKDARSRAPQTLSTEVGQLLRASRTGGYDIRRDG